MLDIKPLAIADVKIIRSKRFADARGVFSEVYKASWFAAAGLPTDFIQGQLFTFCRFRAFCAVCIFRRRPLRKANWCASRAALLSDVAVDLRRGAPTFGQHVTAVLSAENWMQIWIPPGFAHGLLTLEPNTEVNYKVNGGEYAADKEGGPSMGRSGAEHRLARRAGQFYRIAIDGGQRSPAFNLPSSEGA